MKRGRSSSISIPHPNLAESKSFPISRLNYYRAQKYKNGVSMVMNLDSIEEDLSDYSDELEEIKRSS